MNKKEHRAKLIKILQMAYSGELAAALAYAGHWRSSARLEERSSIWQIERDEWEHRKLVGEMLAELGAQPSKWREILMGTIGSVIFFACFISGWFFPMYFAGLLENSNVDEYSVAAEHARQAELSELIDQLLLLAKVERLHEEYFENKIANKHMTKLLVPFFGWGNAHKIPNELVQTGLTKVADLAKR